VATLMPLNICCRGYYVAPDARSVRPPVLMLWRAPSISIALRQKSVDVVNWRESAHGWGCWTTL